jgi:transposase
MIPLPSGTQIWVACGPTDMRRGFDGLAMMVEGVLKKAPHSGHLFVFRGKRADRIKILWWDGTGLCLYAKRLERGRFVWPLTQAGAVMLTAAQLSMLCEGIDWRAPVRTGFDAPRHAG